MSKVLQVKGTINLEMKDGETPEQAENRFYDELDKTEFGYCVFTEMTVLDE